MSARPERETLSANDLVLIGMSLAGTIAAYTATRDSIARIAPTNAEYWDRQIVRLELLRSKINGADGGTLRPMTPRG